MNERVGEGRAGERGRGGEGVIRRGESGRRGEWEKKRVEQGEKFENPQQPDKN